MATVHMGEAGTKSRDKIRANTKLGFVIRDDQEVIETEWIDAYWEAEQKRQDAASPLRV